MSETVNQKRTLYTMLDMAKIVGISKSTVYRIIKADKVKPVKRQGQKDLYDESVLKLVMSRHEEKTISSEPLQRNTIETLEKQLEIKDQQINDLMEQLKMAQINLSQSQQLQLKQAAKIKALERSQHDQDPTNETEQDQGEQSKQKPANPTKEAVSKALSEEAKKHKVGSWWRKLFS